MDDQSASLSESVWGTLSAASTPSERHRIVCVFDEAYSAQGSLVYSAVRLLIDQLGGGVAFEVFCQGAYHGPKLRGGTRVWEGRRGRDLPRIIIRGIERLRRLAISLHICESTSRWASNLKAGEEKLLGRLFDADNIRAVIVFAADVSFALRVVRLAHIYSSANTPHLIVVTPNDRMSVRIKHDLDWLGVRLFRDGDLVVERNRAEVSAGLADPDADVASSVFSFLAPEEYPRPFTDPCSQIDWPAWLGHGRPYPKRVRDVVLFVRPDWTNCGSGTTFQSLARWFRERDSLLIDVGIWPFADNFNPISREAWVAREQDNMGAALYWSARRSTSLPHVVSQIGLLLRWFPWTVVRQKLLKHSVAAKPRAMQQAIRRAKISHIYINHYFTYGYARGFIRGRPFLLDTHDIQTVNFIHNNERNFITRRADRFAASLRDEMDIANEAQQLCFFSEEEVNLAAMYIDRARLHYVLPLPRVVACRARPPGTPPRLLIVSSDNLPNVQGLNWFFAHVWPVVRQLSEDQPRATLRICGNINAAMAHVCLPDVAFVGVVPDLWTYYDEADLVLLPVISGGGVAIKTLEAVLHERPVLATRHALRGMPDDVVQAIGYEDDPVRFAELLLASVADQVKHQARLDRSKQAAALLRAHSFYQTLGEAVDAVRLGESPPNRGHGRSKPIAS